MDIVQLYKEDWAILHMLGCQAVSLPSTKQILWPVVQLTEQWPKTLTYNTDNYNAYKNYIATTTLKCDHSSSEELKMQQWMYRHTKRCVDVKTDV